MNKKTKPNRKTDYRIIREDNSCGESFYSIKEVRCNGNMPIGFGDIDLNMFTNKNDMIEEIIDIASAITRPVLKIKTKIKTKECEWYD